MARMVGKYGAPAVLGRALGVAELRRITAAENVVAAYESRQRSLNWATWAKENHDAARLLSWAERLANNVEN